MTNSRGIYTVDKNGNITQKRSTSSVVTCNLTDLLPDTNYYFAVKAYNSSDQMVAEETGTFETTPIETPIDEVEADEEISDVKAQKILYNGHIYIIYDGKVYNVLGKEVNVQFYR
jgi:phosphodiesterase/alkaline phosphatase D-like protein